MKVVECLKCLNIWKFEIHCIYAILGILLQYTSLSKYGAAVGIWSYLCIEY